MGTIDHGTSHVSQTQQMSCWAASAAMLMGTTEQDILDRFPEFGSDGADEPECQELANELGLNIMPEACRDSNGWWNLIEQGPVMVGIPGHFIVVSGMHYDDDTGTSQLLVNDPAQGGPDWRILETVEAGYEADWDFSHDLLQR